MSSGVTHFGCNVTAVEKTARDLSSVLDELRGSSAQDDAFTDALASRKITDALEKFRTDSSKHREEVAGSVDALKQMLQGLVDGCRQVDTLLADALPASAPGGPAGPAPAPAGQPTGRQPA